jgi:plasmid maintenance system antidote protein VapI
MKIPSDFIEEYLAKEDITTTELASLSGLPRSRIEQVLQHKHNLKENDAKKLADVIGCDFKSLITKRGPRHFDIEKEPHFQAKYSFSRRRKKHLTNVGKFC